MTDKINDGGPAFPRPVSRDPDTFNAPEYFPAFDGMSLRQYAAIKLRVPDSGEEWLDDMIRQTQRDEVAAKVLPELIRELSDIECDDLEARARGLSREAYEYADAMLAAREVKHD